MTAETEWGRACHPKTNSPLNKIVCFQSSEVSEWTVWISRPLQLLPAKVAGSKLSLKALLVGHMCRAEGKVRPHENLTINYKSPKLLGANHRFFMFFWKTAFCKYYSKYRFLTAKICQFKTCVFTCKTLYDSNENYIKYTIYSTSVGKSPQENTYFNFQEDITSFFHSLLLLNCFIKVTPNNYQASYIDFNLVKYTRQWKAHRHSREVWTEMDIGSTPKHN